VETANFSTADIAPPAYRQDLTHRVEIEERGKPALLPKGK